MKTKRKAKALVLFSGGLDSMLAAKLLQEQNIEVEGVCFESNFFSSSKAKKAARELAIKIKIINISKELLEIVKNPPSGYGKHLNPCIDCHALMVRKAGEIAQQEKFDILASGEVLGQRPFSQTKDALARIEKLAGREILRPLSAKRLPETIYEKEGLVIKGRLLSISGRSREVQMELAKKYNLKDYSTPAGGCLLTDPEFSQRLGKILDYWPDCNTNDVELLKHGRVIWLKLTSSKRVLMIIGRNKEDNEKLEKLARKGDIMVELKEIKGPLTIVRSKKSEVRSQKYILDLNIPKKLRMGELKLGDEKSEKDIIELVGLLTGYYATKARGRKIELIIKVKSRLT